MAPVKREPHDSWKIGLAVAATFLTALVVFGWLIAPKKEDAYFTTALIIASTSIGWAVGTMLSPDSRTEEKKFLNIWKGVSLFASGYLISKADPLIEAFFSPVVLIHGVDYLISYRLVACLASVILMTLLTYILRVYAFTVGD